VICPTMGDLPHRPGRNRRDQVSHSLAPRLLDLELVAQRILILEDDATLRRYLGRAFVARGYEVVETSSVAAFIDAGRAGAYDACLLDLSLPDGNGLDAWDRVRTWQTRAIPIVMSARPTAEAEARAHRLGCAAVLTKPFELSAAVAACEARRDQRPNFSMR